MSLGEIFGLEMIKILPNRVLLVIDAGVFQNKGKNYAIFFIMLIFNLFV